MTRVRYVDQCTEQVIPQVGVYVARQLLRFVRIGVGGPRHLHVLARKQRVNGTGHTEQIVLELPRLVVHHLGANEILCVYFGEKDLIGREVGEID